MTRSTTPPPQPPRVSIVVPFYNRKDDVARCLRSLLRQSFTDCEIIAVDNGSTDGTREEIARWPVRLVDARKPGPSAARNAGAKHASGEWIAFIDSDTVVGKHCIERLIAAAHSEENILAVGGRILPQSTTGGVEGFSEHYGVLDQSRFFGGLPGSPPYFASAVCMVRRSAFESIEGFDESIKYSEDADLCWRLLELGGGLCYQPHAVVRHRHRRTFAGLYHQAAGYGRASVDLFAKHRSKLRRRTDVDWQAWLGLALQPWLLLFHIARKPTSNAKTWHLYELVWLAGYCSGRASQSIKRCVICF